MLYKTAREIIENSYFIANLRNQNILDYSQSVNQLNSFYRSIYNDIIDSTDYYLREAVIETNVQYLPTDLYRVKTVRTMSNGLLNTSSKDDLFGDSYKIVNNKIITKQNQTVKIEYYPEPPTITVGIPRIDLTDVLQDCSNVAFDGEYIYFTQSNKEYYYDLQNQETKLCSAPYNKNEGTNSTFFSNGRLELDYENQNFKLVLSTQEINLDSYIKRLGTQVVDVKASNGFLYVVYDDKCCYVYDRQLNRDLLNVGDYYGEENKIDELLAVKVNQKTGKGAIIKTYNDETNQQHIYFISCYPDTLFSLPDSVFYDYLEIRLAIFLASLTDSENTWLLNNRLTEVAKDYAISLQQQVKPYRVNNYNNSRVRY